MTPWQLYSAAAPPRGQRRSLAPVRGMGEHFFARRMSNRFRARALNCEVWTQEMKNSSLDLIFFGAQE